MATVIAMVSVLMVGCGTTITTRVLRPNCVVSSDDNVIVGNNVEEVQYEDVPVVMDNGEVAYASVPQNQAAGCWSHYNYYYQKYPERYSSHPSRREYSQHNYSQKYSWHSGGEFHQSSQSRQSSSSMQHSASSWSDSQHFSEHHGGGRQPQQHVKGERRRDDEKSKNRDQY